MMCINCHCFILSVYHQTDWNVLFLWFPLGSSCLRPLLQAASFPWFCMESWCKTASARSKSSRLRSLVRRQATFQIESIHLFLRDVLTITWGANPGVTWPSCVFGLAPSASLQYLGHLDAQAFTYIYINYIFEQQPTMTVKSTCPFLPILVCQRSIHQICLGRRLDPKYLSSDCRARFAGSIGWATSSQRASFCSWNCGWIFSFSHDFSNLKKKGKWPCNGRVLATHNCGNRLRESKRDQKFQLDISTFLVFASISLSAASFWAMHKRSRNTIRGDHNIRIFCQKQRTKMKVALEGRVGPCGPLRDVWDMVIWVCHHN